MIKKIRGRPKSKIRAKSRSLRAFFSYADRLNLTLIDVHRALKSSLEDAPSYRALQEWRRGNHQPRYISAKAWTDILEKQAMAKIADEEISPGRRRIMAAVRSKNTRPEKLLRKALTALGLRYRLHKKNLPGNPDIVFPREKIAIFCDGDFWHGNNWKARKRKGEFKVRRDYWIPKIEGNIKRDKSVNKELKSLGWTVLRYWESKINKNPDLIAKSIKSVVRKTSSDP